jgi:glycosyltransferase involved in cell wall biosynthesis
MPGIAPARPGTWSVLGGPPLSGESVDVTALVAGLDDPGSVSVVGEVADSSTAYEEADVVIVPSDKPEPFGLIAIEAFARGRPVIASAAGGLLEIVTPGGDGWFFPPKDAAALAELLSSLTRDDVRTAAVAARRTFDERFTAKRFAEGWREAVFNEQGATERPLGTPDRRRRLFSGRRGARTGHAAARSRHRGGSPHG